MRISRIHVDSTLALGASLVLEPEAAHYIGRVLRLPTGAQVSLFNGRDGEFLGTLTEVSKKQVLVELHEAVNCYSDPKLAIHLGVGLSRGERMDFLIQKAKGHRAGCQQHHASFHRALRGQAERRPGRQAPAALATGGDQRL